MEVKMVHGNASYIFKVDCHIFVSVMKYRPLVLHVKQIITKMFEMSLCMRKPTIWVPTRSAQTKLYSHRKMLEA